MLRHGADRASASEDENGYVETDPTRRYGRGKLPDAFHRISDQEAKRFIGRCLQNASKRSTAKQLLSDPFLSSNDRGNLLPTSKSVSATLKTRDTRREDNHGSNISTRRTDMTITGKLNPEDDTIFLKVKIADEKGHVRNIYFPFDIVTDTPIDVANEMVKELEITDREPWKIAEVISKEITLLVPGWKDREPDDEGHHHEYNYCEDTSHPFNSISSPTASNYSEFGAGLSHGEHYWPAAAYQADWLQDDPFSNSDDASSVHSGKYSAMNYHAADEDSLRSMYESRRVEAALADEFKGQCSMFPPDPPPQSLACRKGKKKLSRNQSMVDVRSQLLNRTLLEGLKRRLFKTVGAIENIGFQMPYDETRGKSPSSSPSRGECKKPGFIRGRG